MKQFLITVMVVFILIFTACEVALDVEIKVTGHPASDVTTADIILDGSAMGSRKDFNDVSLPWSYSFTSEEGKIVIVRACCGLHLDDLGIRVEIYKDGSLVGSKNGYSAFVSVML